MLLLIYLYSVVHFFLIESAHLALRKRGLPFILQMGITDASHQVQAKASFLAITIVSFCAHLCIFIFLPAEFLNWDRWNQD